MVCNSEDLDYLDKVTDDEVLFPPHVITCPWTWYHIHTNNHICLLSSSTLENPSIQSIEFA